MPLDLIQLLMKLLKLLLQRYSEVWRLSGGLLTCSWWVPAWLHLGAWFTLGLQIQQIGFFRIDQALGIDSETKLSNRRIKLYDGSPAVQRRTWVQVLVCCVLLSLGIFNFSPIPIFLICKMQQKQKPPYFVSYILPQLKNN